MVKSELEVRKVERVEVVNWSTCMSCKREKGYELNLVGFEDEGLLLCDDCLQELNRKIVEHLAEKNM